jgi:hypothetical protein
MSDHDQAPGPRVSSINATLKITPATAKLQLGGGLVKSLQGLEPTRLWAYALTCGALGLLLNVTLRRLTRLALPGSAHLLAARAP